MKHFTSVQDVKNISDLVLEAQNIKKNPFLHQNLGKNKTLGLIFFNSSLRTRLSTQKAAQNLGMSVMVMNVGQDGWQLEFEEGAVMNGAAAEHAKDAIAVMGQYCDILGVRSFPELKNRDLDYSERVLNSFIKYANVPIVSLESATLHPLQSLADLITMEELKKTACPKVVLSWAAHPRALPQAVPNSFAQWVGAGNYELVITHPKDYELAKEFTKNAMIEHDQDKALAGADFVYAKNWSSYSDYGKIASQDPSWQITSEKMKLTNKAYFMHCLPVRRNVIVSDSVIDSPQSAVIRQAGNRVFSAQVVLKNLLENN
ncbi:MAG: N-acetylornithine carbamoyltransferase [Bacteroidetes bacterium]|nr:MAG: N-acetylornithine carbamoyltransferase [Bacteroidota bacterium]